MRPEGSAELLTLAERAGQLDDQDRLRDQVRRDLVLCLERQPLLLAGGWRTPLVRPSTEGGVLIAFTDDEAARAWAGAQHPAAPTGETWEPTPHPRPGSEREGRSLWLELLDRTGSAVLAVNPAGPMSFLVYDREFKNMRSRLRRRPVAIDGGAWLDLAARARERARLAELMARFTEVVASGDEARIRELSPQLKTQYAFGSLHDATGFRSLIARWRLAFDQIRDGTYELLWSSFMWARIGDPYRSIDGLLEAAELMRTLRARGYEDPEHPGWVETYLRQLEGELPKLTVPYRESERAAVAAWLADEEDG
jgi:hypothetical protein